MAEWFTCFMNCRIARDGKLIEHQRLVVSAETGLILESTGFIGGEAIDLDGAIIAPGFLELQTNGLRGFHFTNLGDGPDAEQVYTRSLEEVARFLPSTGVTGFYPTIPTVSRERYQKILPLLYPREIPNGASILGAHAEGPYLASSKKGAHNENKFESAATNPVEIYGSTAKSNSILKIITLAPELPGSSDLISSLSQKQIRVSLGHSNASFEQGIVALQSGASCLTHTLNAMAPLHHRDPGLAGLITTNPGMTDLQSPYFSLIADGNHLHPSIAAMIFRANPTKCILVTDSIELSGLPDGNYPGHAQIPHRQVKRGSRTTIEGTETLIGSCASLQECVRNLMRWSGCDVAEAVRCVTENVADLMGERKRGRLEEGCWADVVVLDDEGNVLQTWIRGRQVWSGEKT